MKLISTIIFILSISTFCFAQILSTEQLIKESCDYHDFNSEIFSMGLVFKIEETRPGAESRYTTLQFDPSKEYYHINSERDGHTIEYFLQGDSISYLLDGNSTITEDDILKYKLNKERAVLLKNYYYYLWYLPMKLNDEGSYIHPEYKTRELNSKTYIDIKVTYPDQDDPDEWHFYLNPLSHRMEAYQFFKPDGIKGEYILLEGEISFEGLRIPAARSWYINDTHKYLGTDKLISITKAE